MEATADINARSLENLGTDVVVLAGGPGKAVEGIDAGNGIGDGLEFGTPAVHAVAQLAENLVFQRMDVHFGVADDGFAFLHLGRDIAFAVHRRLLADVLLGNRACRLRHLRLGNLDIITENPVVAHLEARDAQAFAFTAFQGCNPFTAFLDVGVHRIEFGIRAFADHPTFTHRERQIVIEVLQQFFATPLGADQGIAESFENRRPQSFQHIRDLGGLRKGTPHPRQVAGIGTSRTDAAHQALHVEDRRQGFLQFIKRDRILYQFRHRFFAFTDLRYRNQRVAHPVPERTSAHRSHREVQNRTEGAGHIVRIQRAHQFQIAERARVKRHEVVEIQDFETCKMRKLGLLLVHQILEQRSRHRRLVGTAIQAEPIQRFHLEVAEQDILGLLRIEQEGWEFRNQDILGFHEVHNGRRNRASLGHDQFLRHTTAELAFKRLHRTVTSSQVARRHVGNSKRRLCRTVLTARLP